MDIHYNAFISYRHHPEDIKVAEQIHRSLEHYKVPKALKKKKDTKLRLFRDKEELPITSNLTDDITRALQNSDFLIVICSTHTKESVWVQREIETFLQSHDHSRVLTVLAGGEPYDTIPEILCREERIDPQTGEKTTLPIEPLSCDWRTGRRKARREELPRLAAALLGCGYDELRQRERQYRARRLAIAASSAMAAIIAFSSYVVYNSIQIQKANDRLTEANIEIQNNLERALTNQSQFLASASSQAHNDGDRMLAMALAMEALPDYAGERPYVARAERALSEEVGAYNVEAEIMTVGAITCDTLIRLFDATDARDRMFVCDQTNVLSVWDLQTFRQITAIQLEGDASKLLVTPDDCVILYDANFTLRCYDRDLQLLWQQEGVNEVALSERRDIVLAQMDSNTLAFFDAATGKEVLQPIRVTLWPEDYVSGWRFSFRQDRFDLNKPVILEFKKWEEKRVVAVEPQTGIITELCSISAEPDIRRTGYTADGNILVLAGGGVWNGRLHDMMTRSPAEYLLACYSSQGACLWTAELTSYSYSSDCTLYAIDENRIFCQADSMMAVVDSASGQILGLCEVGGVPVWTSPGENSAFLILDNGCVGPFDYDDCEFNGFRYLKTDIAAAFGGKGFFCRCSLDKDILVYGSVRDTNWEEFSGEYSALIDCAAAWGDYVAIDNFDSICIFDISEQKLLREIAGEEGSRFQLLKFSDDGAKLWLGDKDKAVIRVDVETGVQERFELPESSGEDVSLYYSSTVEMRMADDVIYTVARDLQTDQIYMVAFDTRTEQITCVKVRDAVWRSTKGCVLITAHGGSAYVWSSTTQSVYQVNIQTQDVKVFAEGFSVWPYIQFLNDGNTYMVSSDQQASFYRENGAPLCTVTLENSSCVSAYITREEILLLLNSGNILRCDLNGQKRGEIETHLYSGFSSKVSYQYRPDMITWTQIGDADLFVNIYEAGNLIDMESWEVRAWVPLCAAYHPGLDRFVTAGRVDSEYRLGVFDRYTLEDIQTMARQALGSYTLTQEQKAYYGIS